MPNKKFIQARSQRILQQTARFAVIIRVWISLTLCVTTFSVYAQKMVGDGFGQTIQITTRFHSFVGKPSWLLVIRDLDHDESVPYLFDITRGEDFWVAFTYGRNYLITASTLQIESYKSWRNSYKNYKIHNFCNLESHGRIQRGESMFVTITGDLSPNTDTYTCNILKFTDANFVVVPDP